MDRGLRPEVGAERQSHGNATSSCRASTSACKQDGTLTFDDSGRQPLFGDAVTDSYKSEQSGWYAQAVWQFMPRWRVGYRYDRLDTGQSTTASSTTASARPRRIFRCSPTTTRSATPRWSTGAPPSSAASGCSSRGTSRASALTDNQVFLQYIMSLGAHGAHKF